MECSKWWTHSFSDHVCISGKYIDIPLYFIWMRSLPVGLGRILILRQSTYIVPYKFIFLLFYHKLSVICNNLPCLHRMECKIEVYMWQQFVYSLAWFTDIFLGEICLHLSNCCWLSHNVFTTLIMHAFFLTYFEERFYTSNKDESKTLVCRLSNSLTNCLFLCIYLECCEMCCHKRLLSWYCIDCISFTRCISIQEQPSEYSAWHCWTRTFIFNKRSIRESNRKYFSNA